MNVVVFGYARSLKGVVGRGWVRCGLWVGVVVGQWWLWIGVVVGCGLWIGVVGVVVGCGLWIGVVVGCGLWIGVVGSWSWIGELKWVVVVDRRLKGVVGCGSATEVGRGRGWVMVEVAPVMTFFEWVCSDVFQIVVGSWSWFAPVVFRFQIGSGDDFFLSAWVCVCVCFCGLWFVLEVEGG